MRSVVLRRAGEGLNALADALQGVGNARLEVGQDDQILKMDAKLNHGLRRSPG